MGSWSSFQQTLLFHPHSHQACGERSLLELSGDDSRGQRLPALPCRWAEVGLSSKQRWVLPSLPGLESEGLALFSQDQSGWIPGRISLAKLPSVLKGAQ